MFNLSHRHTPVPDHLKEEEALFKRIPFEQKLQADAMALAQTMILRGLDNPELAYRLKSSAVQYWEYVDKFHPKYKEKVFHKAKELAHQLKQSWEHHPEQFPMPAPQQPGGGGGMGGMAASEKRTVESGFKSWVLPNGNILVKNGSTYSVKVDEATISFSAPENEAIVLALQKIAAREIA